MNVHSGGRGGNDVECGDKREAVMLAAMELVGEHGFHGSPMALIAERAGVAAGTIYRFFDSKDTLIKEIYASLEGQILAAVSLGYPAGSPVRERFLHTGRQLVRYFLGSPLQFRFLEQFHNSPYGVACRRDKGVRQEKEGTSSSSSSRRLGISRSSRTCRCRFSWP